MPLPRRQFLRLAGATLAAPAVSTGAFAQAWPSRPVRWLVPFTAGGSTDLLARIIAQWLTERLGQSVVVENRPGGGTNIAVQAVVNAPPDGYTLLFTVTTHTINPSLYKTLPFDFKRDIVPVAGLAELPLVLSAHPSLPVKTVPEFIAYAKANPGKINMASSGNGTMPHVAGELFKMMAGIDMVHVPYRGTAPAMTDLLAGQVQVYFPSTAGSIEHIKDGKLRALGVTGATRSPLLPDIATLGDFLPGFEASFWNGVGAPRNTPAEIVERLNMEINAGLADSDIQARLASLDGTLLAGSPADFGRLIADETEKWGKVIRAANIKPD